MGDNRRRVAAVSSQVRTRTSLQAGGGEKDGAGQVDGVTCHVRSIRPQ